MFKKITSFLGTITLVCFSFYYTESAISIIRKTDPIMKQIVDYSDVIGDTSIPSFIFNNNIIPGIKGTRVDIDKSYNNMKRLGEFDKSLVVFEEVLPDNSIVNNYDNYIVSGNKIKEDVSLVFVIENSSFVEEIVKIISLKNIKSTFFVTSSFFDNCTDLIKLITITGNKVELYDNEYDSSTVKRYNVIKKTISNERFNYCYTDYKNDKLLNNCKKNELYTIIPTIKDDNYPYNCIKNNLSNGAIIALSNNKSTVRELSSIINYILQKGKNIVFLEKLIEE